MFSQWQPAAPLAPAAPAALPALRPAGQGLSDRALAWLFVGPTVLLLLAFNIFPLLWTIWLSFTNFRANRPGQGSEWVGLGNYQRVLGNEAIERPPDITYSPCA